ncbi:MAG: hypothetical protein COA79_05225 [Planctomycetota bacterium]|nr:MAG: hypothetical protein COA79_05225 [Planctomycetota bacterium]
MPVIIVKKQNTPTCGIQESIEQLKGSGGTIVIPAGIYTIRKSILLPSNVSFKGDGGKVVLTRNLETFSLLKEDTKLNSMDVEIDDTKGLKVGDEVMIKDFKEYSWHSRHLIIKNIEGHHLTLELLFGKSELVYKTEHTARLWNWFPMLWIIDSENITIKDIEIDGVDWDPAIDRGDFTCSAIHTRNSKDLRINNVTIKNWPADGISIQSSNAIVENCFIDKCRNHGLHPGTGASYGTWINNTVQNCGMDGFFFCMNVKNTVVSGNTFINNSNHGIGGLGTPDRGNIVTNNISCGNGMHGLEATRAEDNIIEGNIFKNNSQKEPGKYSAIYLKSHQGNIVRNNIFIDDQESPTQTTNIICEEPVGENIIEELTP